MAREANSFAASREDRAGEARLAERFGKWRAALGAATHDMPMEPESPKPPWLLESPHHGECSTI